MPTLLSAGQLPPNRHDDLENYDVDDPFATPSPPSSPKKRKEPSSQGLGIDHEVSVQKRARPPNVKLDEDRLLGPAGLPRLRQRARDLKIKGKGHEFADAARLLALYQMWLDDLFPKARFLDALAMVEKAGHKKRVLAARNEMLRRGSAAGRPEEEQQKQQQEEEEEEEPGRAARPGEGHGTPAGSDGAPDEEDLYGATPRKAPRVAAAPDDDADDLDALMAEAEAEAEAEGRAEAEARDGGPGAPEPGSFADDEAAMLETEGL
ncbi:hypothetical protein UVI_02015430 [Ustilaginoidea virens]|uniref:Chromosome segregation in meiosis protein n=1 Tax=Ustilaginoidea virens TaxID=1159556 RepID=A0A1B5KRY9_USTVR|nr:hypothetical protein UVI_02015430 [Ustilaginoidea virens]